MKAPKPKSKPELAPSLPQFLALEKDFIEFGEQLRQAVRIARIPAEVLEENYDLEENPSPKISYPARAEWVLKWLLEKLKAAAIAGNDVSPRTSSESWNLLAYLVQSVPISSAARLLGAADFLTILENTLRESIALDGTATDGRDGPSLNGAMSTEMDLSESSATITELPPPARKRKRDASEPTTTKAARRRVDAKETLPKLLHSIAQALKLMVSQSIPSENSQEAASRVHMRAVFQANESQAARLLGLWFSTLSYSWQIFEPITQSSQNASKLYRSDLYIDPIIEVWHVRNTVTAANAATAANAENPDFFTQCIVPISLFASGLARNIDAAGQASDAPVLLSIVRSLEKLLAQDLFVPARQAFFSKTDKAEDNSQKHRPLSYCLEPLKLAISNTLTKIEDNGRAHNAADAALSSLPLLLSIAIRSAPRGNSKRLHIEMPWLRTVFAELAGCAGIPLDPKASSLSDISSPSLQILEKMLHVLNERGITLEESTVVFIAYKISGLSEKGPEDVEWGIVAQLLKLDPDVFVAGKTNRQDDVNIPDTIINKLGMMTPDDASKGMPPSLHKLSGKPPNLATESVLVTKQTTQISPYKEVQFRILPSLVAAYARARNLDGFLEKWQQQIQHGWDCQIAVRMDSFWNDCDVGSAVRSVLEGSLLSSQIFQELNKHLERLENLHILMSETKEKKTKGSKKEAKDSEELLAGLDIDEKKRLYASFVLTDGIIGGLHSAIYIEELRTILSRIRTLYLTFLQNSKFRSSVFLVPTCSALSTLFRLLSSVETYQEREAPAQEFFSSLSGKLRKAAQNTTSDSASLITEAEVFRLIIAVAVTATEIPDLQDDIQKNMEKMILKAFEELKESMKAPKDKKSTKTRVVDKSAIRTNRLLMTYIAEIIRSPQTLGMLSSEARSLIFKTLYRKALLEKAQKSSKVQNTFQITFREMLDAVIYVVFDSLPHAVRDDLLTVILQTLTAPNFKKLGSEQQQRIVSYAEENFMKIPTTSIKRKQRETILNEIQRICDWKAIAKATLPLSLVVKLMDAPNLTANIAQTPRALWTIAEALDEGWQSETDMEGIEIFKSAVGLILRHMLVVKSEERSQKYMHDFVDAMFNYLTTNYAFYRPASLCIFTTAMAEEEIRTLIATDKSKSGLIRSYASILCTSFAHLDNDAVKDPSPAAQKRNAYLEQSLIDAIAELSPGYGKKADGLADITEKIKLQWASESSDEQSQSKYRSVARFKILARYLSDSETISRALQLLSLELTPKDRKAVLDLSEEYLSSISLEAKKASLSELTADEGIWSVERLEIIRIMLKLEEPPGKSDTSDISLSLLAKLCKQMGKSNDLRSFVILARCILIALDSKPWLTTQYGLETLLSTLTLLLSPQSPQLPPSSSARIYIHVSSLTTTAISLHRTKLRGRFHLLSPLLQALLSCLFTPEQSQQHYRSSLSTSKTYERLPPWLDPKRSKPLPVSAGTSFARVMTTLCSPSVSSATAHRSKSRTAAAPLVDETAKARAYAGQYVAGVVQRYCTEQLRGRLAPGVRAEVMPGLWVALEVMERDAMRAMSAGLGSSERAIWKTLWDDWRRRKRGQGGRVD